MSILNKLKKILYEEEEVEIPVIEDKKTEVEPTPVKERIEEPVEKSSLNLDTVSEREIFKSEKTFNFPSFDEEEFESLTPKVRSTNVMEYEKRKNDKKVEYKDLLKKEVKEEKPKFKPSPIISPVYGILDKNYTPEEITSRKTDRTSGLDVDSVRKKAFGSLTASKEEPEKTTLETDNEIFEEKLEKARTIDELLKDSSDEEITIDTPDIVDEDEEFKTITDLDELLDKEIISKNSEEPENTPEEDVENEEVTDNDLFDLIDSMYDNREDGE